jgi:enamine deaminase RidA (YjgF/YER057c/UK114 family)
MCKGGKSLLSFATCLTPFLHPTLQRPLHPTAKRSRPEIWCLSAVKYHSTLNQVSLISHSIEAATEQSLRNVQRILEAAGLDLRNVVKGERFPHQHRRIMQGWMRRTKASCRTLSRT